MPLADINFDDLTVDRQRVIPNGYQGLNWNAIMAFDSSTASAVDDPGVVAGG